MVQQADSKGQESLLLDYAQRLDRHRDGRRAVHVYLSRLHSQNQRDTHVRIARNALDDFIIKYNGQSFLLGNNDLVFVVKDATLNQVHESVARLRYLFRDDPLIQDDLDSNGNQTRFATIYNIETQYIKFMDLCDYLSSEELTWQKRVEKLEKRTTDHFDDSRSPLKPEQLGRIEEFLARSDLTGVFRRQAVCVVHKISDPKPVFNELFVSIYDLARTVAPDVNLAANRWLFQHLTQTLDQRVLKILTRADDSSLHTSFSINMNVSTLLTQEFLEFDSILRTGSRNTVVMELQLIDILSDYTSFVFARNFLRGKGYRICLDGITPDLIHFFDRQHMQVDLVKLSAGPVFGEGGDPEQFAAVLAGVERIGAGRIILSRCDNEAAIQAGQAMGITMFQGHYLDSLLQQLSRTQNAATPRPKRR